MSQSDDDGECEDWDDCDNHPSDGNLDTEASRDIGTAGPTFRTRGKLQAVVNTLHQVKWSFKQFLHAWMKESCELRHRRYRTFPQRQKALQQTLAGMPKTYLVSTFTATFTAELDALITKPYFGRFDHTAQIDDIDFDHFKLFGKLHLHGIPYWFSYCATRVPIRQAIISLGPRNCIDYRLRLQVLSVIPGLENVRTTWLLYWMPI